MEILYGNGAMALYGHNDTPLVSPAIEIARAQTTTPNPNLTGRRRSPEVEGGRRRKKQNLDVRWEKKYPVII